MVATIHLEKLLLVFGLVIVFGLFPRDAWADDVTATPARLGVMTDMGVPDGFMASLLARTSARTRIHAGVGHNSVGMGIRGGVRVHLRSAPTTPFLAVELGHYFDTAAQPWLRAMAAGELDGAHLDRLSYGFANASLGLRAGSATTAFYLQAGVSYITSDLHLREAQMPSTPMAPSVDVFTRATLRVWSPAARVGLIAYF